MPITSFTVAGNEVDPIFSSFDVRETVGGTSTLSCDVTSSGSPVLRFAVFDEVVVQEDGTTIFAGTVTQTRERGFGGPNLYDTVTGAPQIVTTITAEDMGRIAERVAVTEVVAESTSLKTFLTTLVTTYLSTFGVTLDAAQVTGPSLPAMNFSHTRASEVLQALAEATGYLWRIDYDKSLRMWLPGDLAAPFAIDEYDNPPRWTGDVEVETQLGDDYANRVTVVVDDIILTDQTDTLVGDGVTDVLVTTYPISSHNRFVIVTPGYFFEPLGDGHPTGPTWTIDADLQTLTRLTGPLPVGYTATITYNGLLRISETAEDAGEIAAHGLYEHVERRSDLTDAAGAQALAAQILAERLNSGEQIVTYQTRYTAPTLRAGQRQTIVATARDLSGTYILRDLSIRAEVPATAAYASAGLGLIRSLTAKRTQVLVGKWQQTYKDWLQTGGGGTTIAAGTGGATPSASGGPAPPDTSVQFNRGGGFGGNAAFTYAEDETTVLIGADHIPGGAVNLLVGTGHTVS